MKIGQILKTAGWIAVGSSVLKTLTRTRPEPYAQIDAPQVYNQPIKKSPGSNPIVVNFVFSGDSLGKLIFKWDYSWIEPKESLKYSPGELAEWLRSRILSDADKKSPYVVISKIEGSTATFAFEHNKWLNDTMKGAKARLKYLKNGVLIKWAVPLPDIVLTRYARPFLETWLCRQFKAYFTRNRSALKLQGIFKWLDKIYPGVFDYKIDWFTNELDLTVKSAIVIGALIAAFGAFKKK
jgi:hypothetical protein